MRSPRERVARTVGGGLSPKRSLEFKDRVETVKPTNRTGIINVRNDK